MVKMSAPTDSHSLPEILCYILSFGHVAWNPDKCGNFLQFPVGIHVIPVHPFTCP